MASAPWSPSLSEHVVAETGLWLMEVFKWTKAPPLSTFFPSQLCLTFFLHLAQQLLNLLVSSSSSLSLFPHFSPLFPLSSHESAHPANSEVTLILHTNNIQIIIEKYPSKNPLWQASYKHSKNTHINHTAIWPFALSIFLHTVANN